MKKYIVLFCSIALLAPIQAMASTPTNIIDATYGVGAGSFELGNFVNGGGNPNAPGPDYMGLLPSNTAITGWTVAGPGDGIDWLTGSYAVDTGTYAVDLSHLSASSIYTLFTTVVGNQYEISFVTASLSGLTNAGVVSAGSLVNQGFTATSSDSISTQSFTPFSFLFTATAPTTLLEFRSSGPNSNYGPVIDSVSVSSVPVPGTFWLLLSGLVGLLSLRNRSRVVSGSDSACVFTQLAV